MRRVCFIILIIISQGVVRGQLPSGILTATVVADGSSVKVPCNVLIKDSAGNSFRPDSTYLWKDFMKNIFKEFPSDGSFTINLPYGNYSYEIDRGPEYFLSTGYISVDKPEVQKEIIIKRLIDLRTKNWWSGEMHVHRKPSQIEFLMNASDLHIAPVITSWNEHPPKEYLGDEKDFSVKKFDNDRYYTLTGAEDERSGGALLLLNLSKPVEIGLLTPEYPPLSKRIYEISEKEKNAWIDLDKPFWMDLPMFLATGKVSSIGIAHNHMHKNEVFDNEAWGKKRDLAKYPFPRGNGYWTQDVYYHVLNAGLRIPPSAGSASGVLLNPVGYNRQYAYVENDLTYEKWWQAVKEGKSFVTNGPLLLVRANGKLPGNVFVSGRRIDIKIEGNVYSRDSIESIEIIKNGKLYNTIEKKGDKIFSSVSFDKSGWFLVRVMCKTTDNFRFASTSPFYVEIGKKKNIVSKSSVEFFTNWLEEREKSIKVKDKGQMEEIMKYVNEARDFWQRRFMNVTSE